MDIAALIAQTEALSWDDPSKQIETVSTNTSGASLPLVGQLISQKTNNNQTVHAALDKAWVFALPFSFAVIGPNRFLFKFSKQEHLDRILNQTAWNVNGYLLSLQTWSPQATLGELSFKLSPFWVQVHGFPLANITIRNAAAIGKALGPLLQVEDCSGAQTTFRSYLRIKVKINVYEPLKPGFYLNCGEGEPLWISLKYERLDIYCTTCGRIGHKEQHCDAPSAEITPGKYTISLKVTIFSNLSPHPSGGWSSSEGGSSQSQPPPSQITTIPPGTKPNAPENLNPTTLKPHNKLSQQPLLFTNTAIEPLPTSNQHAYTLNASPAKHTTPTGSDHEDTSLSAKHHHLTQQITSIETCSPSATISSLFPGSLSIELNQFHPGPSFAPNKKAQAKKSLLSPSSPTEKTNFPTRNPQLSQSSSTPANTKHQTPVENSPLEASETTYSIPKNHKNPPKKKRHRISNPFNPYKKGPAALSIDQKSSDDMDTSYTTENQAFPTNTDPPHTPNHFFRAARKGKKVGFSTLSSTKSGDIDLSPKPS
jgi:hypothetical protein